MDDDIDKEFYINPADFDIGKNHNRYMKLKLLSSSQSDKLKMIHLLENGMNKAPQGCINLSNPSSAELLKYVEENF